MTCRTLRIINLSEDFSLNEIISNYANDIVSSNIKFDQSAYAELIFHTPN